MPRQGRTRLLATLFAGLVVLAATLGSGVREASAAGSTISLGTYTATGVCHDGVCKWTPIPLSYLRVTGSGFTPNAPVIVQIIALSSFSIVDDYVVGASASGAIDAKTAIRFCPPASSSQSFMVRAMNVATWSYSNIRTGATCPGSSLPG